MKFSVIDPSAGSGSPMPVIFWLSGLTCSDRNFIEKAGAFEAAAKHGVLIGLPKPYTLKPVPYPINPKPRTLNSKSVCADTSPRTVDIECLT
jgi:S-formylglutathione hydrolase FrmB